MNRVVRSSGSRGALHRLRGVAASQLSGNRAIRLNNSGADWLALQYPLARKGRESLLLPRSPKLTNKPRRLFFLASCELVRHGILLYKTSRMAFAMAAAFFT